MWLCLWGAISWPLLISTLHWFLCAVIYLALVHPLIKHSGLKPWNLWTTTKTFLLSCLGRYFVTAWRRPNLSNIFIFLKYRSQMGNLVRSYIKTESNQRAGRVIRIYRWSRDMTIRGVTNGFLGSTTQEKIHVRYYTWLYACVWGRV